MSPITRKKIELGAVFLDASCYTCRTCCGPKLLKSFHNGYGEYARDLTHDQRLEVELSAREHDQKHDIRISEGGRERFK